MDEMILKEYESPMIWTLLVIFGLYFGYRIWSSWRVCNEYKAEINKLTNELANNPRNIFGS